MKNIKDFDLADLQEEMLAIGEKKFRAEQIFKWIYVDKVITGEKAERLWDELTKSKADRCEVK